ncbi:14718_t:CDS:2, partial [Acaulospora colombiana]
VVIISMRSRIALLSMLKPWSALIPSPMLNEVVDGPTATERDRSLLDSRIIDVSLNKILVKLILGERVPLNITSVKAIDPALGQSLSALQKFADMKKAIETDETLNQMERSKRISKLEVNGVTLEDMCLDFTVPGYDDLELKASGKDISVNTTNVEEYIELVIDTIIGRGARPAVQAFKEGFSTVFPITDLCAFSAEELIMMFGNADEDWSTE